MKGVTVNRSLRDRAGLTLIVASLLSACASITPKMPPAATAGAVPTVYLANRMPTPREKFAIHSVENSYFGVTDARGSLLLGLLLGPIGVAANMAHVRGESERRSDEVKSLLALDAGALLRAESPDLRSATDAADGGRRLEVIPAATLTFVADDTFDGDMARALWRQCRRQAPDHVAGLVRDDDR